MKTQTSNQPGRDEIGKKRAPYEAPAIIYEGLITTRAGSVPASADPGSSSFSGSSADPANSFGGPGG
ncbi:MAG: hypothetical protein R3293_04300 [Candidatus Promineifilaceae bacterium]|nr:hypothetical protein [Candidatus Promineifilaceae bacterium]